MKNGSQSLAYRDPHFAIWSFGITSIRVLGAIFIGAILLSGIGMGKETAVAGILAIMVADYFDGRLFLRSGLEESKYWRITRRWVDSTADRLVIQLVCIPLLIVDYSFLSVYLAIVLREVVISGYSSRLFRSGFVIYPRGLAKVACALVGASVISYLVLAQTTTLFVTSLMLVLSACAFREYQKRVPPGSVVNASEMEAKVEVF
jgi:phosphatidylglycerophosphate synthase